MPNITNLTTTTALTTVENKTPNVTNLVKKLTIAQKLIKLKKKNTDHDHDKDNTTEEFDKLTAENFSARLAQAKVILLIS